MYFEQTIIAIENILTLIKFSTDHKVISTQKYNIKSNISASFIWYHI